jgi:hypothetical protein
VISETEISKKYLVLASSENTIVSPDGYSFPVRTGRYFSSRIIHSETLAFLAIITRTVTFCEKMVSGRMEINEIKRIFFIPENNV